MATDSAAAIDPNTAVTDEAYISPAVDFAVVLAGMSVLALVGAAIILP